MKALRASMDRVDSPVYVRPAPVSVETRAAGGAPSVPTHHHHRVQLFETTAPSPTRVSQPPPVPPLHLRSALEGSGASARNYTGPSYLRPTSASTAHSAARPGSPAPITLARGAADDSTQPPAGGDPNRAFGDQIDFSHERPRTMRRSFSLPRRSSPATTASIASPARGLTRESPRFSKDTAMFADASTGAAAPFSSRTAVRPPLSPMHHSTHDKSLPNSRRSQRGTGCCQPAPALTSAAALATSESMLIGSSDVGQRLPRRGRGTASPMVARPPAPSENAAPSGSGQPSHQQEASTDLRKAGYIGAISGVQCDNLLGGRKARGLCSPRPLRGSNPLTWD
eukprot:CAMPEP_0174715934 /NCGR_PEP_ID=MMETSP1094-20130205/22695_1 /TAXON_ID=156173 /ORGANISM="Chrysochromulina brevifilum, Strain UTEX LB 985" /LENGTH=339 /DNA_ID=CAMNT_0015915603 /DNA_START=45 /DNA_END=1064 /DNA_ORIENTATION=+